MKTIVCIFAHPDDEAFGPGGTIAKLASKNKVYLICATKGDAGKHNGARGNKELNKIRGRELLASAKVLGVKKVFFLGFRDGDLSNNLYHRLAGKIETILKRLRADTILTYEPGGVSGHIDHITVSMVSSFVFQRLPFIKRLMQFCVLDTPERRKRKYFIYLPRAYKESEVDLAVDIRKVWDTKVEAMMQHQSQMHDIKRVMKIYENYPKKEFFLLTNKSRRRF